MFKLISALLLVSTLVFMGCGGSGSSGDATDKNPGSENNSPSTVVIDSAQKATNAIAALDTISNLSDELDVNVIPDTAQNVNLPLFQSKNRAVQDINHTGNCLISGTVSLTGTTSDTTPPYINITTTFTQCKNQIDKTTNGSIHAEGTENNMSIVFNNYAQTDSNGTKTMNLTGHILNEGTTSTIQMDGTISEPARSVTFANYIVQIDNSAHTITINGQVTLTHIPSNCADGIYVLETIQSLQEDPVTENIISGQIKINNVLFTFQPDGSATATINGQEITIDTENATIVCN